MLNRLNENGHDGVRKIVLEELSEVLVDREEGAIGDEMNLNSDLGLSSLDLAALVAVLDQRFRRSPFRQEVAITSVRSVADLCAAYRGGEEARRLSENQLLERTMQRALSRRGAPALR